MKEHCNSTRVGEPLAPVVAATDGPTETGTVREFGADAPMWRCFHCDEIFTDRESAADHFGVQIDGLADEVGCKLTEQEGGILKMLREAQEELRRYHEEDSNMARTFHALGAEHSVALRTEEEKGYARGLADAKKHPEELGPIAAPLPAHVCGLQGYNGMIDPPCPACVRNRKPIPVPSAQSPDGEHR